MFLILTKACSNDNIKAKEKIKGENKRCKEQ